MPTYTILDKSTKEEYDVTIGSWDEFQEILKSDNNLEQVFRMNYAYRLEKLKVSVLLKSHKKELNDIRRIC
jgi:hypothetical protein